MGTMPELPEAQTIADQLQGQLAGRAIGTVRLERRDIVRTSFGDIEEAVAGRRVVRVYRRAKRVVLQLDSEGLIVFGLGMTGRLTVVGVGAVAEKHTHLRIGFPEIASELHFRDPRRFGGIWLHACKGAEGKRVFEQDVFGNLGVEPLSCTAAEFRALLSRRRQIKALLMDQSVIAGLGNIYCDESLHAAGIHPLAIASRLSDETCSRLLRAIKEILRKAIRCNGSTLLDYRGADGSKGGFQLLHRIYGREGEPCKGCGTKIKRIQAAGRSTHFCPKCQRRTRSK